MLFCNFLHGVEPESWHPVLGNWVVNHSGSLGLLGDSFFESELLPLGQHFWLGDWLLSWENHVGEREVNGVLRFGIFENFSVLATCFELLLPV